MANSDTGSDSDFEPASSPISDVATARPIDRGQPTSRTLPQSSQLTQFEISSPIRYSHQPRTLPQRAEDGQPSTPVFRLKTAEAIPFEVPTHLADKPFAQEPTYFTRPNRFLGAAATWRSWTEHDRAIASAIDQEAATDLSRHLYNAYALKKKSDLAEIQNQQHVTDRGRRPDREGRKRAQSQNTEETAGEQYQEISTFKPPRVWTAWPLPPDEVPRESFLPSIGPGGLRKAEDLRSSTALQECLIALTTGFARKLWETREWEHDAENSYESSTADNQASGTSSSRDNDERHVLKEAEDLTKDESNADTSMQDVSEPDESEEGGVGENNSSDEVASPSEQITSQLDDGENAKPYLFSSQMFGPDSPSDQSPSIVRHKHVGEHDEDSFKPVFTTDDEQAHQLITPSARHIMSQLNAILLAAHQSRQSYAYGRDRSRSQSERSASAEKHYDVGSQGEAPGATTRPLSQSRSPRNKRHSKRVTSEQNPGRKQEPSQTGMQFRSEPLNPHDWSSILGLASIVQAFQPETISRAAERCARLFGENMLFRTFHEAGSQPPATEIEPSLEGISPTKLSEGPWFQDDFIIDDEEDNSSSGSEASIEVILQRISRSCLSCRDSKSKCAAPSSQSAHRIRTQDLVACDRCVRHGIDCSEIEVAEILQVTNHEREIVCPYEDCERTTIPFSKLGNLRRHIALRHPGEAPPPPASREVSRKRSFSSMRGEKMDTQHEPFFCPVTSCPRSLGGTGDPFKVGSRLYAHVRKAHPEVDVDMLKQLEVQRRGERRGRWTDERRYRSRSRGEESGSRKRVQRLMDSGDV